MCDNSDVLIVSVLGGFRYSPVYYSVQGVDVGCFKHSSIALRKYYSEVKGCGRVSLLYVAPESLVTFLAEDAGSVGELLVDEDKLIGLMMSRARNCLGAEDFDLCIIDSFGEYHDGDGYAVAFDVSYSNVVFSILVELARRVLAEEDGGRAPTLLVVDASTGHNIYALALIDAVRSVIVASKLKSMLVERKPFLKTLLATCSPVFKGVEKSRIELSELGVKAFFAFPAKDLEGIASPLYLFENKQEGGKLARRNSIKAKTKRLAGKISWARTAFNAIKYNTPLVLYGEGNSILSFEEDNLSACKEAIDVLMEIKRVLRSKEFTRIETRELLRKDNKTTSITVTRPRLSKGRVAELLLSACLATGIAEFLVREIKGKTPDTKEILSTFTSLYKRIGQGLAARFLERDIEEVEEVVEQAEKVGWRGEKKICKNSWNWPRRRRTKTRRRTAIAEKRRGKR